MYDKGYAPLAVAVKLDISADEAESYKIEYWRLNHMNEFEQIYKANKDSLPLIISKFRELQAHNISLDRLTQAITLVTSMPQLLNERQRLNNEIQVVNADYKQRQGALWNIQSEIRLKETDLRNTVLENNRIEHIKNMN